MADNVAVTEGSGKNIATEDTGGFQVQRVKPTLGAAGTAVNLSISSGNKDTGTQRVTLATDDIPLALVATDLGGVTETAPATDTASSGLNGRLQRIAQRITSLIAQVPAALGQTTMASSMSVAIASNQSAVPISLAAAAAAIAKAEDVASADADVGVPAMAVRKATPANTSGTDGDYEMLQMSAGRLWASVINEASENVIGKTPNPAATVDVSITRPADTNAYVANDAWADSTSAPTAGGFTFTSAGRISGGSGTITDIVISSSNDPATLLQAELWIFDQAVTAVNDNAAFALSDSDVLNLVAVVPFTLATTTGGSGTNSFAHVQGLGIGYTCAGTANLRLLVKVKNAYTPASAEVLKVRLKLVQG